MDGLMVRSVHTELIIRNLYGRSIMHTKVVLLLFVYQAVANSFALVEMKVTSVFGKLDQESLFRTLKNTVHVLPRSNCSPMILIFFHALVINQFYAGT